MWATGGAKSFALWVAAEHDLSVQTARAPGPAGSDAARPPAADRRRGDSRGGSPSSRPGCWRRWRRPPSSGARCWPTRRTRATRRSWSTTPSTSASTTCAWSPAGGPPTPTPTPTTAATSRPATATTWRSSGSGDMYDVRGQLTVHDGQALKAALAAVTPPRAPDDQRSAAQRRATALVDLARIALDAEQAPARPRTVRPRINVLVDYPTFAALLTSARAKGHPGCAGRRRDGPVRSPSFATPGIVTGSAVAGGPQYEDGTPISRAALDLAACDCELARFVFGAQLRGPRRRTGPAHLHRATPRRADRPGQALPLPRLHRPTDPVRRAPRRRNGPATTATPPSAAASCCAPSTTSLVHQPRHPASTTDDDGWTFTDRHGRPITGDHDRRLVRRM